MPSDANTKIYSATYSNVPVFEYNIAGNHVMRRRADDWINATHILKVADFDKPARTRILEREVQKGVHEKVQGGYGKYQGTWVPLHDGRILAERNGVLEKLLPIFDYKPGDRSPPPAPKHATAASNRPKVPRQSAAARRNAAFPTASQSQISEEQFDNGSVQFAKEDTPDNETVVSESMLGDQDMLGASQYSASSRKRKRGADQMALQDQQHQIWADALLDYFMLLESDDRFPAPPEPPANVNLDRPIDEKGHSAMHWAAAMGDVEVVKELMRRGARIDCLSNNLETPLMRAVMFTNNFDKNTMPSMVKIFQQTVVRTDWFGSTVFHHIAATTSSTNKYVCARYYLDCIINKLLETWVPEEVTRLLNIQDKNGDTAIMIAARNGARKCVRSFLGRFVTTDIPNNKGETADDLFHELNLRRRQAGRPRQPSSSPFGPDPRMNGDLVPHPFQTSLATSIPTAVQFHSSTASHLMTKIVPTLHQKCEELAIAYEDELKEKEEEYEEAERVARKRQQELDSIRRELALLSSDDEPELDQAQEEELASLVREAEALLEVEQRAELRRLSTNAQSQKQNHIGKEAAGSDAALHEKLRLAFLLSRAQVERRVLVSEVIQNLSVAGMGERQSEYKQLIKGALNIREEEIEEMLPDILGDLEEAEEERKRQEASPL
ncbi:apses-domain-containing protein [Mytilinidion resinicola]|uniref:Apses-domain-containing protein n=1 Tax=Mytilinidion resinicola TaxID=574789 RepID=A0A6A6Z892_9PEZI|nr:apses-domain-containing protein [Mytilinidion resinicola]KAF2816939.1 apses-domain-containing protein [Mytilinidion resinicola]